MSSGVNDEPVLQEGKSQESIGRSRSVFSTPTIPTGNQVTKSVNKPHYPKSFGNGGMKMKLNNTFPTLLSMFVMVSCSQDEPLEVERRWGSYKEYFPDVIEYDYIRMIIHDKVVISCASGQGRQGYVFGNQAVAFEDTRSDTESRVFKGTSIAMRYLPHCWTIQSIEDFEIALAELKLMDKAIDICGEMNVDGTGEKLREVMACQEDIIYEKSSAQ